MPEIAYGKRFAKSYKKISRSGHFDDTELQGIIALLKKGERLPDKYHDHALAGDFAGIREFHLQGDLVVIYVINIEIDTVKMLDIGNHANLFE